ncbi:MAG: sodium:solute symporter family protein, partial [Bacteroidota bacterium]
KKQFNLYIMNIFEVLLNHPLIPLFIVANLAIGWWAHRKATTGSFEDYALASRNLPTGVLVMTLLGTFISRGVLAAPGFTFQYGMLNSFNLSFTILSFLIVGTFIAPCLVYFQESITLGDLMGKLYGKLAQFVTGIISLILILSSLISQIRGIGSVSFYLLEIDPWKAILCFGILVLVYSIWGGMRTVSYTDVLQIICALASFVFITQTLLKRQGGVTLLFENLSIHHARKLRFFSDPYFFSEFKASIFWALSLASVMSPPMVQRMLVTQDKREVRKMWYASAFLFTIICIMIVFIGLSAVVEKASFDPRQGKENLLLSLIKSLFKNKWILEALFLGFSAIILSTIDSFLHAMGNSLVQDIIGPIRIFLGKKELNSSEKSFFSKVGVGLVGSIVILIGALRNLSIPIWFFSQYAILAFSTVVVPLIIGILGIKTDKNSWISFCVVYLLTLGVLQWYGWGIYDRFLLSVFLATLAYFATHIYINQGIAILTRSKLTVAERLWIPSWEGTMKQLRSWLTAPLRLPAIADRKIVTTPTQSLAFSLMMIFLYMVGSITVVDVSNESLYRMAAIRGIGITLCVGLMLEGIWSKGLRPYFPMYWFLTLWYCLSFASSLTFLQSQQSAMSIALWVGSFVILAALVDSSTFLVLSTLGSALALGGWRVVYGRLPEDLWKEKHINPGIFIAFIVLVFIVSRLIFVRRREEYNDKRLEWNRIAAGILAHDLRGTVHMLDGSGKTLQNAFKEGEEMNNKEGKEGYHLLKGRSLFLKNSSLLVRIYLRSDFS